LGKEQVFHDRKQEVSIIKSGVLYPSIVLFHPTKKRLLLPLTEFKGIRSGLKTSYEFNYTGEHHFFKKVYRVAAEGNRGSSHQSPFIKKYQIPAPCSIIQLVVQEALA
jgi:hypothetical protein